VGRRRDAAVSATRSTAVLVAFVVGVAASARAHAKPPLLAVSAEAGGEIVLVDPAKAQVVERIKVGARPRGLKLTKDKRQLLVALAGAPKTALKPGSPAAAPPAGSAGLVVVDVGARKVTKQVATPPSPFAVDLLPDGRTAFMSNSETNEVFVIDTVDGLVKKKLAVGAEPQAIVTRPDGKVVYAVTHTANELSAIDPKKVTLLGRIDAGVKPQAILFAPHGGDLAFVLDEGVPTITLIDTKHNQPKGMIVVQPLTKTPAAIMQSAVFSPDGKVLYVTTGAGKSVLIVDPAKKAVVGAIDGVGAFPRGIAISADGKKLYTANGSSNDVAIIDIASKKVEARVAVPGAPWGVVVLP
jgi:YVTN family beta-propeller protein